MSISVLHRISLLCVVFAHSVWFSVFSLGWTEVVADWDPFTKQSIGANISAQLYYALHVFQQHFTDFQDVFHGTIKWERLGGAFFFLLYRCFRKPATCLVVLQYMVCKRDDIFLHINDVGNFLVNKNRMWTWKQPSTFGLKIIMIYKNCNFYVVD